MKAVFSYVGDGYKVNFTDYSANAKEYLWEFGDTTTSTLTNPIHVYHSKGEFLAKLTVTNGQETNTFVDTVFVAGPNIKIDGDFTDWTSNGGPQFSLLFWCINKFGNELRHLNRLAAFRCMRKQLVDAFFDL